MANGYSITIANLAKFRSALTRAPAQALGEVGKALRKSALQVVRETVPLTPIDTGVLAGSIGEPRAGGIFEVMKGRALVGTHIKYSIYVHEGFQRHRLGQRKYLETGLKNAVPKIREFFRDAYVNVVDGVVRDSR